jgi:G3E family GTPase
MVTVVDASTILTEFQSTDSLRDRGEHVAEEDVRTIAHLLVDQIEFADVVLINKTDLVDERTLRDVNKLIRSMNPKCITIESSYANIPLECVLNTGRFDLDEAESSTAWKEELNAEHVPETEEYGISSVTFQSRRPFHPTRFYHWLRQTIDGVVRAKGFFWIAPYPELALFISQAGPQKRIDHAGYWWTAVDRSQWPREAELRDQIRNEFEGEWGDRRQELVFIGVGIDGEAIRTSLDSCLLSDQEMDGLGPYNIESVWSGKENPFAHFIATQDED